MKDILNSDYEPNDMSTDMFLSEGPLNLLIEQIRDQFEEPYEERKYDYVQTFINMYNYSTDNANVYEEDEQEDLDQLRSKFYSFLQEILRKYLNIGFNDFDELSKEDQDHMIHYTYRFFITRIKKNFVGYIMNYLEDNKTAIFNEDIYNEQKDVTALTVKKEISDPEMAYILSNLESIIDDILSEEIDVDDFLAKCDGDNCLETEFVTEAFKDFKLTGNFVKNYIEMIDDDFMNKIHLSVRGKLLKKYR